jgi:hypothetical protein
MKRTAGAFVVLAALGGCVSTDPGPSTGGWANGGPAVVPGVQGPWGQPVAMAAPYTATPPSGEEAARAMMAQSVPLEVLQTGGQFRPDAPGSILRAGGPALTPAANMMQTPNMPHQPIMPASYPPGAVAGVGAITAPHGSQFSARRTEVSFTAPYGMKVAWYAAGSDGKPGFKAHVDAPGRYNFIQGAVYRLKLSDLPGRPGVDLYPTLEVVPASARTDAFLAHSAVPVGFTNDDLDKVAAGNYLVKVIYLPDPQFQELSVAGPEEVVSTQLEPGVDPIAEAQRRGNILLVIRLGNIDLELASSPAMDAPNQNMPHPPPPGYGPGQRGMMGLGAPVIPGAVDSNGQPMSKLSDAAAVQQAQYRNASTSAVAAQKAAQPSVMMPVKKTEKSERWWWPNDE